MAHLPQRLVVTQQMLLQGRQIGPVRRDSGRTCRPTSKHTQRPANQRYTGRLMYSNYKRIVSHDQHCVTGPAELLPGSV